MRKRRQNHDRCPQVKVATGVVSEAASAFLLLLLSFNASLLSSSNTLTALKIVWRHAPRSTARSDQAMWSKGHGARDFLRQSLNCFFGAPLWCQWTAHHTKQFLVNDGSPFWRHTQSTRGGTSVVWFKCWG